MPVDLSCDYFVPFANRFKLAIHKAVAERGGDPLLIFLDRNTDFEDASIGSCPTGAFSLPNASANSFLNCSDYTCVYSSSYQCSMAECREGKRIAKDSERQKKQARVTEKIIHKIYHRERAGYRPRRCSGVRVGSTLVRSRAYRDEIVSVLGWCGSRPGLEFGTDCVWEFKSGE